MAEVDAVDWSRLPTVALVNIFTQLDGCVLSLCAAASVCTTWGTAATDPAPWRTLKLLENFQGVWQRRAVPSGACALTDNLLGKLVARSQGSLISATLHNQPFLTDKCLLLFSPARAPNLQNLSLKGCTNITLKGVSTALAGAKLDHLALKDISRLTDAENEEELFEALAELVVDFARDQIVDSACQCTEPDGTWNMEDTQRCGKLFNSTEKGVKWCGICEDLFCADCSDTLSRFMFTCSNCKLRGDPESESDDMANFACKSCCGTEILPGNDWETSGFICAICGKMLCADCSYDEVVSHGMLTHWICGVCEKHVCVDCVNKGDAGCTCSSGTFRGVPSADCMRYVCVDCWCREDKLNMLQCSSCSLPFCSACISDGITGRFIPEALYQPEEAFCTSCRREGQPKAKAKAKKR